MEMGNISQSTESVANNIPSGRIETVLNNAGQQLLNALPNESTLAIINIRSDNPEISEFIIEELEYILVNSRGNNLRIVDRRSLERIRAENNFQLSGEVNDATVISIGKFLGANMVITGSITGTGTLRRLRIRVLDVLTAEVTASISERF
jgi:hypothetical protein